MRKNYWKALTLAAMLLGAGCSEEDTPTATPPDAGVEETVLVNFHANGWYNFDDETLQHHYVLVSDQKGEVLALERYQKGFLRAIKVPGEFDDEKLQLTFLHYGTRTKEGQAVKEISAISFLDVDRGTDWQIITYQNEDEFTSVGNASLTFDNVGDNVTYGVQLSVLGENKYIDKEQLNNAIEVPIYHTPTPLMVSLYMKGDTYTSRVDNVVANESYTVDVEKMQKLSRKTLPISVKGYDNISASIDRAFIKQDNFNAENTLGITSGFSIDANGDATIKYPSDLFPAYESNYELEKDNFHYYINLKGQIPDAFPSPSLSASFNSTSDNTFDMNVQGSFDGFIASWKKEEQDRKVNWVVVGSPKNSSYKLPTLPDSLSLNAEGLYCDNVSFVHYSHINSYHEFLQGLHGDYTKIRKSTREEQISYFFNRTENTRTRQREVSVPFLLRK